MRTLVQISDLHFGRIDPLLPEALRHAIGQARPDVVVSGDLTQRARSQQFREAAAFLRTLPAPRIVVPGNHDVPLYDIVRRFAAPLDRFRTHIEADPFPTFIDDEIAVVGVNTARSLVFKGGRVNAGQVAEVARRFRDLPESVTRIVVTHHPFDLPEGRKENDLVGRATMAMAAFADAGTDVFLSGHLHHSHASSTAARYRIEGFAAIVIQAGTTTSTRTRHGQGNAFNVLRIDGDVLDLETWSWLPEQAAFVAGTAQRFNYSHGTGWAAAPAPAAA